MELDKDSDADGEKLFVLEADSELLQVTLHDELKDSEFDPE